MVVEERKILCFPLQYCSCNDDEFATTTMRKVMPFHEGDVTKENLEAIVSIHSTVETVVVVEWIDTW